MTHRLLSALLVAAIHCLFLIQGATAADRASDAARQWRTAHESDILKEFTSLHAIPNVASDTPNIRRNADTLVAMLKRRNVEARLLAIPNAPPIVYGEIKTPG